MDNLFANLPKLLPDESLPNELVTELVRLPHVRIERIVSTGHASPENFWYDQDEHEWVTVLTGSATLRYKDGEQITLDPGDHVLIPAHRRHRVEWTTPEAATVWLAVFFGGETNSFSTPESASGDPPE